MQTCRNGCGREHGVFLTLAFQELAHLLPAPGDVKRRAFAQSPNHLATVLWIEAGNLRILLGADLLFSNHPNEGWRAIVATTNRPQGQAHIFKVPHHGSENADCREVWDQMLITSPYAVVAPYSSGIKPLPSPSDLSRLCGRTPNVYCTASPAGWSAPRREPVVERTIKEVARNRRAITGPMGHVRLRAAANLVEPAIAVELFSGAYHACNLN